MSTKKKQEEKKVVPSDQNPNLPKNKAIAKAKQDQRIEIKKKQEEARAAEKLERTQRRLRCWDRIKPILEEENCTFLAQVLFSEGQNPQYVSQLVALPLK